MYYAGIGSRETPQDIGLIMTNLARECELAGFILRSGGAKGADTFFENGVSDPANKQIFIHDEWVRGRRHDRRLGIYNAQRFDNYADAYALAAEVHGHWHKCGNVARELHARNVYQVLGEDMAPETYSSFLVCWAIPDIHGVPEGGTRTAWQIARMHNISCYNLALRADRDRIEAWLDSRKAA